MSERIFRQHPHEAFDLPVSTFKIKECLEFPLHYHSALEWVYVYEGQLNIEVNHQAFELKQGDFMSIGSHHIHNFSSAGQKVTYRLIHMDVSNIQFYGDVPYLLAKTVLYDDDKPIHKVIEAIDHDFEGDSDETGIGLLRYGYELLEILVKRTATMAAPDEDIKKVRDFIAKVNAHIYEHYSEGLTLTQVSKAVGYSSHYLSRKFQDYMGMNFKKYLLMFQVSRAREALAHTDRKVSDVAFDCGFKSMVSFNRVFKEVTGMTPTEFRHG